MSAWDNYYDEMFEREHAIRESIYNSIIEEFNDLSLEEKVNELIKIYARERANK